MTIKRKSSKKTKKVNKNNNKNSNNNKKSSKLSKTVKPYHKLNRQLTKKEIDFLLGDEFKKLIRKNNKTLNTFKNTPIYNLFNEILKKSFKLYNNTYNNNKIKFYFDKYSNKSLFNNYPETMTCNSAEAFGSKKVFCLNLFLDIGANLKNDGKIHFPIKTTQLTKKHKWYNKKKSYIKQTKKWINQYSYTPKTGEIIVLDGNILHKRTNIKEKNNNIPKKNRYILEIIIQK